MTQYSESLDAVVSGLQSSRTEGLTLSLIHICHFPGQDKGVGMCLRQRASEKHVYNWTVI